MDASDGSFGKSIKAVFERQAPKVPVRIMDPGDKLPVEVEISAVILPGSLAVNPPKSLDAWLRGFSGSRLVVPDETAGVYWANDFGQAVQSARLLAEGQEIRPQSAKKTSAWTIVAYVFAILFALQLLFLVLAVGISTLVD
jgi:hypothetical protein